MIPDSHRSRARPPALESIDARWRSVKARGREQSGWQYHCLRQQILVLCNCAATPEAWQAVTEDSELQEALKAGEKANFAMVAGGFGNHRLFRVRGEANWCTFWSRTALRPRPCP